MSKSIYKSDEGRQIIINQYDKLLGYLTIEHEKRYLNTSFGKTFLIEAGDETLPPLLLLHGSCSNSAMWIEDIKILINHYHVFAVDILGEPGRSAEIRLDVKSDDYAKWLEEILDQLNITNAVLIGNSYGGWMAMKFAVNFPQRVSKLVLLASSGIVPAKLSFIFKSIIYGMQGEKGLISLNKMVFGSDKIPAEVIEATNIVMKNFNPYMGSLPIYTEEQLKRLTMPTLYIAGENDCTVNAEKSAQRLKLILPIATTEIIKDQGHVVFGAVDKIIAFLKN